MKKRIMCCFLSLFIVLPLFTLQVPANPTEPTVKQATGVEAVNEILGNGVTASNISFNGDPRQLGVFSVPDETLPLSKGIAISTGEVTTIFGAPGEVIDGKYARPGNSNLEDMVGLSTKDAAVLEFDVTPDNDEFSFSFFFMSQEYSQAQQYNDIFALWIYDPLLGLQSNTVFPSGEKGLMHYNCARLPNGQIVTISNSRGGGPINGTVPDTMPYAHKITNSKLNGITLRANGYTDLFYADAGDLLDGNGDKLVQPGRTLRVCMAITDVSDTVVDSTVFIGANSVRFEKAPDDGSTIPDDDDDEPVIPGEHHDSDGHCIDYSKPDLIVPGSMPGFEINLTKETITIPSEYTPVLYSIDGGNRWRPVKQNLSEKKFPRLFNKILILHLSDKPLVKATKKPEEDAQIVEFAKINKRPRAPKLMINYLIGADPTGNTLGEWVFTEKNGNNAIKENIQIGVGDPNNKFKTVNELGYGHFYEGETNGICIKPMNQTKVQKTTYFMRTAPQQNGEEYTAASKPKKMKASGALKMTRYKVKTKQEKKNKDGSIKKPASATITVKKGTYVKMNNEVKLYTAKEVLDVLDYTGQIEIWTEAKLKKPAGTKQIITL